MKGLGVLLAFCALLALSRPAAAQTVSPSDLNPARKKADAGILARVKGRVSAETEQGTTDSFNVSRGRLVVEQGWLNDPTTGEDVLRGRVTFEPGPSAPACRSVRLVQAARVEAKLGQDLDWPDGQANRNLMRTQAAPGVEPGYFIDHDAIKCRPGAPCSAYFRDSWPNPDESADGASGPGAKPASLVDYPFGWTYFERISLEACARCVDTGEFLACAKWGGTWPTTGDRFTRRAEAADAPSATFLAAFKRFEQFYPTRP